MARPAPGVRGRLLDAALDLFLEHGYEGSSLQMLADRLGVTKAALYYHYRAKDDLLAALYAPAAEELLALLDEVESLRGPARRRLIEAYVDFLLRHRRLVVLVDRDINVATNPRVREGLEATRSHILGMLAGGELSMPERLRFAAALGALQAIVAGFLEAEDAVLRPSMLEIANTLLPRR